MNKFGNFNEYQLTGNNSMRITINRLEYTKKAWDKLMFDLNIKDSGVLPEEVEKLSFDAINISNDTVSRVPKSKQR